ncbi:hypothetical protein MP638_006607 [Amoeboaphelidium occidentale]|nr:hypothetical protein MP638_006607 [Amoeboaphelidium occidentale]
MLSVSEGFNDENSSPNTSGPSGNKITLRGLPNGDFVFTIGAELFHCPKSDGKPKAAQKIPLVECDGSIETFTVNGDELLLLDSGMNLTLLKGSEGKVTSSESLKDLFGTSAKNVYDFWLLLQDSAAFGFHHEGVLRIDLKTKKTVEVKFYSDFVHACFSCRVLVCLCSRDGQQELQLYDPKRLVLLKKIALSLKVVSIAEFTGNCVMLQCDQEIIQFDLKHEQIVTKIAFKERLMALNSTFGLIQGLEGSYFVKSLVAVEKKIELSYEQKLALVHKNPTLLKKYNVDLNDLYSFETIKMVNRCSEEEYKYGRDLREIFMIELERTKNLKAVSILMTRHFSTKESLVKEYLLSSLVRTEVTLKDNRNIVWFIKNDLIAKQKISVEWFVSVFIMKTIGESVVLCLELVEHLLDDLMGKQVARKRNNIDLPKDRVQAATDRSSHDLQSIIDLRDDLLSVVFLYEQFNVKVPSVMEYKSNGLKHYLNGIISALLMTFDTVLDLQKHIGKLYARYGSVVSTILVENLTSRRDLNSTLVEVVFFFTKEEEITSELVKHLILNDNLDLAAKYVHPEHVYYHLFVIGRVKRMLGHGVNLNAIKPMRLLKYLIHKNTPLDDCYILSELYENELPKERVRMEYRRKHGGTEGLTEEEINVISQSLYLQMEYKTSPDLMKRYLSFKPKDPEVSRLLQIYEEFGILIRPNENKIDRFFECFESEFVDVIINKPYILELFWLNPIEVGKGMITKKLIKKESVFLLEHILESADKNSVDYEDLCREYAKFIIASNMRLSKYFYSTMGFFNDLITVQCIQVKSDKFAPQKPPRISEFSISLLVWNEDLKSNLLGLIAGGKERDYYLSKLRAIVKGSHELQLRLNTDFSEPTIVSLLANYFNNGVDANVLLYCLFNLVSDTKSIEYLLRNNISNKKNAYTIAWLASLTNEENKIQLEQLVRNTKWLVVFEKLGMQNCEKELRNEESLASLSVALYTSGSSIEVLEEFISDFNIFPETVFLKLLSQLLLQGKDVHGLFNHFFYNHEPNKEKLNDELVEVIQAVNKYDYAIIETCFDLILIATDNNDEIAKKGKRLIEILRDFKTQTEEVIPYHDLALNPLRTLENFLTLDYYPLLAQLCQPLDITMDDFLKVFVIKKLIPTNCDFATIKPLVVKIKDSSAICEVYKALLSCSDEQVSMNEKILCIRNYTNALKKMDPVDEVKIEELGLLNIKLNIRIILGSEDFEFEKNGEYELVSSVFYQRYNQGQIGPSLIPIIHELLLLFDLNMTSFITSLVEKYVHGLLDQSQFQGIIYLISESPESTSTILDRLLKIAMNTSPKIVPPIRIRALEIVLKFRECKQVEPYLLTLYYLQTCAELGIVITTSEFDAIDKLLFCKSVYSTKARSEMLLEFLVVTMLDYDLVHDLLFDEILSQINDHVFVYQCFKMLQQQHKSEVLLRNMDLFQRTVFLLLENNYLDFYLMKELMATVIVEYPCFPKEMFRIRI